MPLFAKKTIATDHESSGGRLVSVDGKALPLLGAHLRAEARGGLARITLEQTFRNPHAEPLHVTYQMPLPSDGAVSGYAFTLGEQRIVGEVDRKARARERFEEAILEGRTAGLVDQERSSLFTQELGNVPPGALVVAELTLDQKLTWLPEGTWEWRFPTVVAPRYLGAEGSVADADKITVEVAATQLRAGISLALDIQDRLAGESRPESPSHPLASVHGLDRWTVTLGDETARLDRDVVVRWRAAEREPGVTLTVGRPAADRAHGTSAYGLLTLTPPSPRFEPSALPRDLIVLLDTSGSMSGEPLDQARRIVSALVESLTEKDQLELIEFSNSPRRWKGKAVEGSVKNRRSAISWLNGLRASGGTEMRTGILEALAPLRDGAQRQIILVTDGLIGSENEVLTEILQRLPGASRVHTVGIGSAVNRSLTQPAARAGRGVELIVGIGEDVERAAQRLVARTCAPLLTGVTVSGSALEATSPRRIPDVFAGAPSLIPVRLRAEGGELIVRAASADGAYEQRLQVDPVKPSSGSAAVCAVFGRETVEDLELELAGGASRKEIDAQIEKLGLTFQISTRLTSWIAVSEARTVDPTSPTRKHLVPQELPHGMSVDGLGLRHATHAMAPPPPMQVAPSGMATRGRAPAPSMKKKGMAEFGAVGGGAPRDQAKTEMAPPSPPSFEAYAADEDDAPLEGGAFPEPVPEAPLEKERRADVSPSRPAPARQEEHTATRAGTLKAWPGQILRRTETELIIQFEVPFPLTSLPGTTVRVRLDDGREVEVTLDATRSTRPGALAQGMVVRLALTFPAGSFGAADPRELLFATQPLSVVISL